MDHLNKRGLRINVYIAGQFLWHEKQLRIFNGQRVDGRCAWGREVSFLSSI